MQPLYDQIGKQYDTTRKADPEITRRLHVHLQLGQGNVLDIACGTGNYTLALQQLGLNMTGVDISTEMIQQAKGKSNAIRWDQADVQALPYAEGTFDGATCILSAHHFPQLLQPLREVYRVLKRGRFVLFTSSPEQMKKYWLNEYFPQALHHSAEQMPPVSTLVQRLQEAGFNVIGVETFLVQPNLQDFFLYSGKYKPEMYLYETVRSGISTFANLAAEKEIEEGCRRLRQDIATGRITEVLAQYTSDLGDYAFVVVEKI